MITQTNYKQLLSSRGTTQGEIRKKQSDYLMDSTFTRDVAYKKVYVLTPNGWIFTDAKYQTHTAQSIAKDAVDYYLQFRPSVHFPIGSYVIVPDDTSPDLNLSDSEMMNPFTQPVEKRSQWWMIVGRDNANAFVRYNILQCNWNFQWVYDGEVKSCFGCVRNANSYTSGKWSDSLSSSPDDLVNSWLPNPYHVYGENFEKLGLDDVRTIKHEQRFMLTNNVIDPKVYLVTKVLELFPEGIVKLSLKQDEFNFDRDNIDLRICDYYTSNGEANHVHIQDDELCEVHTGVITQMVINSDNELITSNTLNTVLSRGVSSYYNVNFNNSNLALNWNISLVDVNAEFTQEEHDYYCGLIKLTQYNDTTVVVKPGKAKSLINKRFVLSVVDHSGLHYSSIELEVS